MSGDVELIIELRDDGTSYPEIGRILDMNPEAVRSAWRRAKGVHTKQTDDDSDNDSIVFDDRFVSHQIKSTEQIKVAFPTDLHCPYQDDYAVDLALRIVEDFAPSVLVCGSDGVDFYRLSKFDKNPNKRDGIYAEIKSWQRVQRQFNDAAPSSDKIFLIGNHEDRLRRHNWHHNPDMADHPLSVLDNVMELSKVGITHTAAHEIVFNDILCIKHGNRVSKESAYTAKAELLDERYAVHTMTGHVHRGGTHYVTSRRGTVRADECFCLCDMYPEYVRRPNWQQGIAVATVIGQEVYVEPIPFWGAGRDKVAFWRGKRYTI